MKKTLVVLAATAAVALVSIGAPTDANAQYRRHGGGGAAAAGIIGGLAAGAIIGGALASQPHYYAPAPAYVVPEDCVQRQWVWSERRGEYVRRNVRVPC